MTVKGIETIISRMRRDVVGFTWFIKRMMWQLGAKMFKLKVLLGLMKPSEFFTVSDEALGLVILFNNVPTWLKEGQLKIDGMLEEKKGEIPPPSNVDKGEEVGRGRDSTCSMSYMTW